MTGARSTLIKVSCYTVVMVLISAGLIVVFGNFRSGSTHSYKAVFTNVSGLKPGQNVRAAGVLLGKVTSVRLQRNADVVVEFDAADSRPLDSGTRAAVRYENLIGDRYLDLSEDSAVSAPTPLPAGQTIPATRTTPALDIDSLIGGFKPLFQSVQPSEVNSLMTALVATFQGQGQAVKALLDNTAALSGRIADQDAVIGEVVDNFTTVLTTVVDRRREVTDTINQLQSLVSQVANQPDPLGPIVDHLESATLVTGNLLQRVRPDLQPTIADLNRTATTINQGTGDGNLDTVLSRLPDAYKRLSRMGAYGGVFQLYACQVIVRLSDPAGKNIDIPFIDQNTGRCAR